jgi:putative hydrolase of the HAD superfamily
MDKIDLKGIKNIIFDLGNVVVDLDIKATDIAFKKLSNERYDQIMQALKADEFFERYETGQISTATFVKNLQENIGGSVSEKAITDAWNAMLLDIPDIRYNILKEAQKKYRTFCLSNTNELHIEYVYNQLKETKGIENLADYFEKVYLSHEMGQRKPNLDIFETVIKENHLQPNETLFIDDTAGHLEGAEKAGLHTFHMSDERRLEDVLNL